MSDRFLQTGGGNVNLSNGSLNLFAGVIGAANLQASRPIKTNSVKQLVSEKLDINDINNLQYDLNNKISLNFVEGDLHSAPSAGQIKIYAKTDGELYKKDENDVETAIGGGGGLNYTQGSAVVQNGLIFRDGTSTDKVLNDTTLSFDPATKILKIDGELDVDKIKNTGHTAEIEFENTGALNLRCDSLINISNTVGEIDITSNSDVHLRGATVSTQASGDIRLVSDVEIENFAPKVSFRPLIEGPNTKKIEVIGPDNKISFIAGTTEKAYIKEELDDLNINCGNVVSITSGNDINIGSTADTSIIAQNINTISNNINVANATNTKNIDIDSYFNKIVFKDSSTEKGSIIANTASLNINSDNPCIFSSSSSTNTTVIDSVNQTITMKDGATPKFTISYNILGTQLTSDTNLLLNCSLGDIIFNTSGSGQVRLNQYTPTATDSLVTKSYVDSRGTGFSPFPISMADIVIPGQTSQFYYQTLSTSTFNLATMTTFNNGSSVGNVYLAVYRGTLLDYTNAVCIAKGSYDSATNPSIATTTLTIQPGQSNLIQVNEPLIVGLYMTATTVDLLGSSHGLSDNINSGYNTTNLGSEMPDTIPFLNGSGTGNYKFCCSLNT